jgi:hypothetical protein
VFVSPSDAVAAPSFSPRAGGAATLLILLVITMAAALSVDVVKNEFGGVKGDEATYVAMALSVAFDHDLSYQRRDLDRFREVYRSDPQGIFLKLGEQPHVRLDGSPPFLHLNRGPDPRQDRLYFGKAFIYPVVAAPFVRVAGLNGFLVLHALLIFGVLFCGYQFLAARSRPIPALVFTLAFVAVTVIPVYTLFLTSDIFNFALVFFAYFLWLYKEVAPPEGIRFFRSFGSDIAAAVLLAVATFSKPPNVLLIGPVVLLFWWRRRFWRGMIAGLVFVAATAGLFGINAWSSGEFNYQGGERKTFYGSFPFDSPDATWNRRGIASATNDSDAENVLQPSEFVNRFGHNVEYFLVGRHFGFVPYFFPGFLAVSLWLASRERFRPWRLLTFLGLLASTIALLVFLPYSWSGGGGPAGNRYFLSLYPLVFFLTPPLASMAAPIVALIGGALFTAQMLLHPFVAAKFTYLMTERGPARLLPVELTMAQDLPVMLSTAPVRGRIPYRDDPVMLLYFLDQNAFPPEPAGMWVGGERRADIIVRTEEPLDHLAVTATSPIPTTLSVSMGAKPVAVPIVPGSKVSFDVPARGVRDQRSYAYLLSASSSEGFVPHLRDPNSSDYRNLGAQMEFTAVLAIPNRARR